MNSFVSDGADMDSDDVGGSFTNFNISKLDTIEYSVSKSDTINLQLLTVLQSHGILYMIDCHIELHFFANV